MASTYTTNNGIELIGTGEQSGIWGDTTNTNFELIDASLDGQVSIELASTGTSGSPNTVAITDGDSSDGRNRMFIFTDGASFSGDAYVQLTPNDAEKIVYVRNNFSSSSPHSIVLFQGNYNSSNAYTVPRGKTAVVYFNGSGLGAVAANMFNNAHFDALNLVGNADVGGNLTVTGDVVAGDDVSLQSDGAVLNFGADDDVSLTHIADTAIRLNTNKGLQFRDAAISIASSADGQLDIDADTEVEITTTTLDIDATTTNISGTLTASSITEGSTALASKYLGINANADSATKWQTARTITLTGDVSGTATGVDGQNNISIETTIQANKVALGTDTTGNYVQSLATTSPLSGGAAGSEGPNLTISLADAYGDTKNPFGSKSANLVLAGPNSGSSSAPSFRSLVAADIPTLTLGTHTNGNYVQSLATTSPLSGGASGSEGPNLTISLAAAYGDTQNPFGSKSANYVLAAPSGSSGSPSFRSLVAADIPSLAISNVSGLQTALDGKLSLTGAVYQTVAGRLGINTPTTSNNGVPTATLHVSQNSSTENNALRVDGAYTGVNPLSFYLYNYSTAQNASETVSIEAGNNGYPTNNYYSRRHQSKILFEPNGTSGGEIAFRTGGQSGTGNDAEALRLKSNQDAEFSGSITAADGILFGSDTAAANTLNDYEEGYFTPLYEAQTSNFAYQAYYDETGTYRTVGSYSSTSRAMYHSSARGFYTKIGDTVHFSLYIYVQTIGLSGVSGYLYIKGLPYTSANNTSFQLVREGMTACSLGYVYGWTNFPTQAYVPNNASYILLSRLSGSTWSFITAADMGTAAADNRLLISGSYKV